MARILCFDYGRVRIGASISDPNRIIASPLQVFLRHKDLQVTFQEIQTKIKPLQPVDLLVVGLPLLLNGKEGEMATEAKSFAKALSDFLQIPFEVWDERLTSLQAERLLKQDALSRKQRAQKVDTLASTLILQSYLSHLEK